MSLDSDLFFTMLIFKKSSFFFKIRKLALCFSLLWYTCRDGRLPSWPIPPSQVQVYTSFVYIKIVLTTLWVCMFEWAGTLVIGCRTFCYRRISDFTLVILSISTRRLILIRTFLIIVLLSNILSFLPSCIYIQYLNINT